MRAVRSIEYVVKKESNIDENLIYAFGKKDDINILVRKNGVFYWKSLQATNMVWYQEYDTIEDAIEGVFAVSEYKDRQYTGIMEFDDLAEFLHWSVNTTKSMGTEELLKA